MALWMAVIFALSSQPAGALPDVGLVVCKLAHLLEYLILAILVMSALNWSIRSSVTGAATTVLVSAVYAVSDEIHQLFVPGRNGSPLDVLIDIAGAIIGILLFSQLHKLRFRQQYRRE